MKPIYRQTYTLSSLHVDCFGRAKPSTLLYFAQEVAGQHCTALSVDLSGTDLFWVVIRHRVQVTRLPVRGETITVETWPMPTTRVAYPRSVVAYDERGNEVFRSISLWVLMDRRTRAMILPGKSGIAVPGTVRGTELAVPNSLVPRVHCNHSSRTVGFTQLDGNGHMNNTRYLDWVADLLPSAYHRAHEIREFTICYLSEATEGQQIELDWELAEGPVLQVDAHRQSGEDSTKRERVFSVQVQY